ASHSRAVVPSAMCRDCSQVTVRATVYTSYSLTMEVLDAHICPCSLPSLLPVHAKPWVTGWHTTHRRAGPAAHAVDSRDPPRVSIPIVYFRCYRLWTRLSCFEAFSGKSASMIDVLACPAPLLGAGANHRQQTSPSGRHARAEACFLCDRRVDGA